MLYQLSYTHHGTFDADAAHVTGRGYTLPRVRPTAPGGVTRPAQASGLSSYFAPAALAVSESGPGSGTNSTSR